MNNTDWKILIYLREDRSINKVAKRLFMTQPSLTYRLDQMEKEIGVPLFIRTNRGVHFTDAGVRLFSYAEKELQQYQDMKNFVTHEKSTISGVLRIGASRSFTQSHMPTLLKGFVDKYNDIEISLTQGASDRLTKMVKKEDIQLAIVRGEQDWNEMDILLDNAPMYLISAGKIDYSTLANQPTIRISPAVSARIHGQFKKASSMCRFPVKILTGMPLFPRHVRPERPVSSCRIPHMRIKYRPAFLLYR